MQENDKDFFSQLQKLYEQSTTNNFADYKNAVINKFFPDEDINNQHTPLGKLIDQTFNFFKNDKKKYKDSFSGNNTNNISAINESYQIHYNKYLDFKKLLKISLIALGITALLGLGLFLGAPFLATPVILPLVQAGGIAVAAMGGLLAGTFAAKATLGLHKVKKNNYHKLAAVANLEKEFIKSEIDKAIQARNTTTSGKSQDTNNQKVEELKQLNLSKDEKSIILQALNDSKVQNNWKEPNCGNFTVSCNILQNKHILILQRDNNKITTNIMEQDKEAIINYLQSPEISAKPGISDIGKLNLSKEDYANIINKLTNTDVDYQTINQFSIKIKDNDLTINSNSNQEKQLTISNVDQKEVIDYCKLQIKIQDQLDKNQKKLEDINKRTRAKEILINRIADEIFKGQTRLLL
jgi:hypothetical protein